MKINDTYISATKEIIETKNISATDINNIINVNIINYNRNNTVKKLDVSIVKEKQVELSVNKSSNKSQKNNTKKD